MTHKHGIAGSPHNHAQHGYPEVRHADGGSGSITNAKHVAHGFEEGIRVLLPPGIILQERKKVQSDKSTED